MERTPTQVVEALLASLNTRDWIAAAKLFSEEFLEHFARHSVPRQWQAQFMTAEEYLRHDPNMPPQMAEYLAQRATRSKDHLLSHMFAGTRDVAELEALPPAEVYARSLQASDPSTHFGQHLDRIQASHPEHSDQLNAVRGGRAWWQGEVMHEFISDGRAYVLCWVTGPRPTAVHATDSVPQVLVLRETTEGWRVTNAESLHVPVGFGPIEVTDETGNRVTLTA